MKEAPVRAHLNKINMHKSMGPDELPPQVLRELAVTARLLLIIIFGGGVHGGWGRLLRTGRWQMSPSA